VPDRAVIALATNLLVRGALVASPGRKARDGTPSHVRFAITRALLQAVSFKTPSVAVAVFDADAPELAARGKTELKAELDGLRTLFAAHGFVNVEASRPADVAASYARAAIERGYDVVVVGSDKRLAQLVGDETWWYDAYKDVRYTPDMVRKRFDVGPDRVAEWLAMVGDEDVLPGVKGVGKKSATELITTYGSIDRALDEAASIEGRIGNALRASLDDARRELARARLDRSRPLPRPLDELAYRTPDAAALQALYADLGFLELLAAEQRSIDVVVCTDDVTTKAALAAFDPNAVAIYALAEDPSLVRGELAGVALVQGDRAVYVPLLGKGAVANGIPPSLADFLRSPHPKIGHDVASLRAAFLARDIVLDGVRGDSACASHLHEPSGLAPHDLGVLAPPLLRRALTEEDAVRGVGRARKSWSQIAVDEAAQYAAELARASADVFATLAPTTDRALLDEYLALSETLARMAHHGIACDAENLSRAGADFERIGAELEARIHELAGHEFNVNSTKQLGEVLFDELKLPVASKTKTGYSTATEALERIENAHPIVPLVIRFRMLRRLTDSWVTALIAAIAGDGRVHATMYAARSFSGRVICANPDLGRVPAKNEEMMRIRQAFTVAPGHTLLSVDYEQLGLYVLAHLTKDPALVEPLRSGADMHVLTAAAVLEIAEDAVGETERQIGKVVNFATFAGQGASALALQLGVSAQEAKDLIARFDRRYAIVRAFQDEQFRLSRERGYIVTLAGRRWPIRDLDSPDVMIRSYAERLARRATHEGSVADVSRRGLLDADRALRRAGLDASTLLQIHDEVLFEVRTGEIEQAARLAAEAMRTAFALEVPLRVGVYAGPTWAELASIADR
jgi:DNA polymerase-1